MVRPWKSCPSLLFSQDKPTKFSFQPGTVSTKAFSKGQWRPEWLPLSAAPNAPLTETAAHYDTFGREKFSVWTLKSLVVAIVGMQIWKTVQMQ